MQNDEQETAGILHEQFETIIKAHTDVVDDFKEEINRQKAMETVVGMNKASATRNARTAMTGAQNAGRQQAYDRAKAMGIKVKKEWIATLDGRTRHSHGKADGQQVELDGKFTVGRAKMRYPGDVQNGTPEEIYNCRCTMVTVEPPEILQGEEPRRTYQEWYKTKEGQETLEKARLERNKKATKRRKAKNKQQNNAQNGLKSSSKNGIIRSDGKVDLHNGEHWYEYIGEIDFTSAKAIKFLLLDFEKKYADSKIENCRVITKQGKVFDIHGDKHTVNTNLLGELMNGSINEHNHVTGESQYSFSYEDLLYSALDGSYISSAYDEKFRYKMTFIRKYTEDEVYAAYNKAKEIVYNRSIFEKSIVDEDFQHEFILETCKILNIKYKRVKK